MPRQKGPGAIKPLDAATQDDVLMRTILWRGENVVRPSELRQRLKRLTGEKERLTVELLKARQKGRPERERLSGALDNINKQIEEAQKQIKAPQKKRKKAALPWQEMAVLLIMEHKMIQAKILDEDFVLGTKGATISTKLLQQMLRKLGFSVGERQLRRFIHDRCGVVGHQGTRTDLTSDNSYS